MLVVSDASPLIALADAGLLELLRLAFGEIVIPEEVDQEVFKRRGRVKPSWIKIQPLVGVAGLAAFVEMRNVLDKGESAAIALAGVLGGTVLIDEALGTAECKKRRIPCLSTAQAVAQLISDDKITRKRSQSIVVALQAYGVYVE